MPVISVIQLLKLRQKACAQSMDTQALNPLFYLKATPDKFDDLCLSL